MLYRFKSEAGADVLMLAESAESLLRLMGRAPAPQGILERADLPRLIQALEQGVAADEADFEAAVAEARSRGEALPRRSGISLRQRAWPLRELLRQAHAARVDVVWGV